MHHGRDVFRVEPSKPAAARAITTGLWPAFPSDLVSLVTVLATQAEGRTLVHDWMYELRLFALEQLSGMGADLFLCDPHRIIVTGPSKLRGRTLDSRDLRSGMALIAAGLAAEDRAGWRRSRRSNAATDSSSSGYKSWARRSRSCRSCCRQRRRLTKSIYLLILRPCAASPVTSSHSKLRFVKRLPISANADKTLSTATSSRRNCAGSETRGCSPRTDAVPRARPTRGNGAPREPMGRPGDSGSRKPPRSPSLHADRSGRCGARRSLAKRHRPFAETASTMGAGMRRWPSTIVAAAVRGWTWLYTLPLDTAIKCARRAEINSDLWESRHDARAAGALHLLIRAAIGVPDDLLWCGEQLPDHSRTVRPLAAFKCGIVIMAASGLVASASRAPLDVGHVLHVNVTSTGWVPVAKRPAGTLLVPAVTFTLANLADRSTSALQVNAIFYGGAANNDGWGGRFVSVVGWRGLAPGATSRAIAVNAQSWNVEDDAGIARRLAILHIVIPEARVKLFLRHEGRWTLLADDPIRPELMQQ